jgi:Tol biopolymer transport system component
MGCMLVAVIVAVLSGGCGSVDSYDDVGPQWSADGRWIAFSRVRDARLDELYVMRPDGSGIRRVAKDVDEWVLSPDGTRIAFETLGDDLVYRIWLFTFRSGSVTRLTRNTIDDEDPAWAPDGKRLAFIRGGIVDKALVVMNLATRAVSVVIREGDDSADPWGPQWSPDGRRIAFVGGIFPDRLFIVPVDARPRRGIARTRTFESIGVPRWSPDGQSVVFDAGPMGSRDDGYLSDQAEIYVARADAGGLTRLTRNGLADTLREVSPNGRRLLVKTGRAADADSEETYVLRANGTGRMRLAGRAAEVANGGWSPDGGSIAIARDDGDGSRIFVMDAAGHQKWYVADDRCRAASGSR